MYRYITIVSLFFFFSSPKIWAEDAQPSIDTDDLKKTELALQIKDLQSKAMFQYYRKNYIGADSIIRQLQNLAPNSIEFNYLSGLAGYVKKDYTKSIEFLLKSIETNPDHELSLYLLGMNYAALNDWENALTYFTRASNVTYNPYYQLNLAVAELFNNDIPGAIAAAKKAIELKANYDEAKIILSRLFALNDQKGEAWSFCEELKNLYATDLHFANHCANLAFYNNNDWKEVINILGKRKNLDANEQRLLAKSWFKLNQFQNAVSYYRSFIYSPSMDKEEGLEYLEILMMNGNGPELEKFKQLYLSKFPQMSAKVKSMTFVAETKKDSLDRFYYQFKQIR